MDMSLWVPVLGGFVAAIAGAVIAHVYRDFRDRPILQISLDAVKRLRSPIRLPAEHFDNLDRSGDFENWLATVVKWKVPEAFERNEFTPQQLKDMLTLIPRFLSKVRHFEERFQQYRASIVGDVLTLSPEDTLAGVRHRWMQNHHEDVFMAFKKDPKAVTDKLIASFDGDLAQLRIMRSNLEKVHKYLERGLAPDTPAADRIVASVYEPSSPRRPFLILDVLVQNSGRTAALIRDSAILKLPNRDLRLRGLIESVGFEVYSGKYYKIKPYAIAEMTFSQDPDQTNMAQLKEVAQILREGNQTARIVLEDYNGRRILTKQFLLQEIAQDA